MAERVYRCEALIMRRTDFAEADRLLLLATPGGKRRVVAKGARKTTSRLAGHLELFTSTTMILAIGRNLDIVTQSQTRQSHSTLRADLTRLSCAYYAAELYDQFTGEEDHSPDIFQLLETVFAALNQTHAPDLVLRWYELHLLSLLGYRPNVQNCVACGQPLDETAQRFSPSLGGMLCPNCENNDRRALFLPLGAFKLMRYLQQQPVTIVEQLQLSAEVRHITSQTLRAYLRVLLERELKSLAFLDAMAETIERP